MISPKKQGGKRRGPKRRSLTAHSLEDAKFRVRVLSNSLKYTRKGKHNDRKSIRFSIEDGE